MEREGGGTLEVVKPFEGGCSDNSGCYMHLERNRCHSFASDNGWPVRADHHGLSPVLQACQSGLADGEWSPSHAYVTVTGSAQTPEHRRTRERHRRPRN